MIVGKLRLTSAQLLREAVMKRALLIAGIAALLMGLLWIGQGTGFVHWPASSFMLDQRPWATRGAILAIVGIILIAIARKR
jgi:hypothetical protein